MYTSPVNTAAQQMPNADKLNDYKVPIERLVKPKEKYSWLKNGAIIGAVNGGIIGAGVGIYHYIHSPEMASRIKSFATTAFEVLYENRKDCLYMVSLGCIIIGGYKGIFLIKPYIESNLEKDDAIAAKMQKEVACEVFKAFPWTVVGIGLAVVAGSVDSRSN